jgi:hypothetical protein
LLVSLCLATGCRWGFETLAVTDADTGIDGDAGAASALCTKNWCWDDPPAPERLTLRAISGSGPTDIWAVGDAGVIRRYDGPWHTVTSPTHDALFAIDVVSPTDVTIAASAGVLWHYDGTDWTAATTPSGSSAAALWRDGATNKLWAAGENGTVSVDNVAIASQPGRIAGLALHGTSATNVWHAGVFNTVSHWTGSWSSALGISDFPRGVWALTTGDAFAVGAAIWRCAAGSCVNQAVATAALNGLWGTSDTDIWAVGASGTFQHWNGSSWQQAVAPDLMNYLAVWGSSSTDVWAVGGVGAIAHYSGGTWQSVGTTVPQGNHWRSLWVGADDDRWIGHDTSLFHSDGRTGSDVTLPASAVSYDEIEGTTADLYTLDNGLQGILHYDGSNWSIEPGVTLLNPRGLAVDSREVLASSQDGAIVRKPTGGTWAQPFNQAGTEYHGVCLSQSGAALAVGRFGAAAQRTSAPGTWNANNAPTGRFLLACDFAVEKAWAAGGDAVVTWTAGTWTPDTSVPSGQSFADILAVSDTEVYVAGGRLYGFDGTSWSEQALPTGSFVFKVVRGTDGTIYAVADEAGVLRRQ